MEKLNILNVTAENILDYGLCGYKNMKNEGVIKKVNWFRERFKEGLIYKILVAEDNKQIGAIDYVKGEYAWRPIEADGYMVIGCIYIMSKVYKGVGYGKMLLDECEKDAKRLGMKGVASVTRKGSWMVSSGIFTKNGYEVVDAAKKGFELVVKKFDSKYDSPKFCKNLEEKAAKYKDGLYMFVSNQCPYIDKAIKEISKVACEDYGIKANLVELKSSNDIKESPCAFGTFCMVYNGKLVADNPISSTRFKNIMNKLLN